MAPRLNLNPGADGPAEPEPGFPTECTNPNGGAIAQGHHIGATGAILLVKLAHELQRIGRRYGIATMCIGGDQGIAVVVANVPGRGH
jgi:acetyl-CoA C-acetyltransferase